MREPICLSWSGGKDSALALHSLRDSPDYEVTALLTSVTSEYDRISIHGVRRALLERQAEQLGIPLLILALEPRSSNEAYEAAFRRALSELAALQPAVTRIAFGDLHLREVRDYRDRLLRTTAFTGLYPLWDLPTRDLADHFIDAGFQATLVCTDNTQIDSAFAGRAFDRALLADLPATADPCGENGEFHTFVHAGPIFREPIPIMRGETIVREERFTYVDLYEG